MLDRNRRIKEKPERFQENKDEFDLIVTCQERVFDQVLESEYIHHFFSTLKFSSRLLVDDLCKILIDPLRIREEISDRETQN